MTVCPTCGAKTESKNGWHQNCYRPKVGDFISRRYEPDKNVTKNYKVYLNSRQVEKSEVWVNGKLLNEKYSRVFQVTKEYEDGGIETREFDREEKWVFRIKQIRKANNKDISRAVANKIKGHSSNMYREDSDGTVTITLPHTVTNVNVGVSVSGSGGSGSKIDYIPKSDFGVDLFSTCKDVDVSIQTLDEEDRIFTPFEDGT